MVKTQNRRGRLSGDVQMLAWAQSLALLLSALLCAHAADGQPPAESEVNIKASRVYIHVGKVGLGHEHAVVGRIKSGYLRLGADADAGAIVFDLTTFVADTTEAREYVGLQGTTSAATRKEVTTNMLGGDVLDVRKFPTATFAIASAWPVKARSQDGPMWYRLQGDFTLHGVTRPLTLDAEAIEERDGTRLRGSFAVRQTAFGIQPYSKAFGAVGVTDEISIYGEMILTKGGAAAARGRDRR
ncbi:MAG: YceI family protein [Planctomycetaceae bacterium]